MTEKIYDWKETEFSDTHGGVRWRAPVRNAIQKDPRFSGLNFDLPSRTTHLYIHKPEKVFYEQAKIRLGSDSAGLSAYFYVEKGLADSRDSAQILDETWHWHTLIDLIETKDFLAQFNQLGPVDVKLDILRGEKRIRSVNYKLVNSRLTSDSLEVISASQFCDELRAIEPNEWCDLFIGRRWDKAELLDTSKDIFQTEVLSFTEALIPIYMEVFNAAPKAKSIFATTREAIVEALERFDREVRITDKWAGWEDKQTFIYAIDHDARLYPPKEILSIASGVPVKKFTGGEQTNSVLRDLGFAITELHGQARQYWKIAPGERARNWEACRAEGYIAIGWNKLGDLIDVSHEEFEQRRSRISVASSERGWSKNSTKQVWDFVNEIQIGDRIIANLGTREVVGVGTVTGAYYFVDGEVYGHRRKVTWDVDFEVRKVIQPGWGRTIIKLEKATYDAIMAVSAANEHQEETRAENIYEFIRSAGFYFPNEIITNYALSLAAKPFVILTGISGTGKTKIAQLFAEYMCSGDKGQVDEDRKAFISVRPDWMDNRGLLGFYNLITEEYEPSELLKLMLRASGQCMRSVAAGEVDKPNECLDGCGALVEKRFVSGHDGRLVRRLMREEGLSHVQAVEKVKSLPPKPVSPARAGKQKVMMTIHKTGPFFAILDEMNLARIEQYFSDFLSCLETRREGADGVLVQEAIVLHSRPHAVVFTDNDDTVYEIPPKLHIPPNFYFTGTVNIDETTYMFSPKVLDRASVIEFNEVNLDSYLNPPPDDDGYTLAGDQQLELATFKPAARADYLALGERYQIKLGEIIGILAKYNKHFGYRTVNEISRYMDFVKSAMGESQLETAFDLQILQRILPKLHGTRAQLETLLQEMQAFTFVGMPTKQILAQLTDEAEELGLSDSGLDEVNANDELSMADGGESENQLAESAVYPRSHRKLGRMIETIQQQGFVSFIE